MSKKSESSPPKSKTLKSSAVRLATDAVHERQFEPQMTVKSWIRIVSISLGCVSFGAATYGQFLRTDPSKYAFALFGAGAALFLLAFLGGESLESLATVGDLGVGLRRSETETDRIGWNDILQIRLLPTALVIQSHGNSLHFPISSHKVAVQQILFEAKTRVPKKLEGLDISKELMIENAMGQEISVAPIQVIGTACKASGVILQYDKDARICRSCGEVYHLKHVPTRCISCEQSL